MSEVGFKHKLAAILSADVVGYSRLITYDEVSTVRTLNLYRDEMTALASKYEGRVVDFVGDNMLAEFPSALDAVNYTIHIQRLLEQYNEKLPPAQRVDFRFGLDLGDIMIDGERIYGDGVNLAARLQALAEPCEIIISDTVYKQIRGKFNFQYVDLGEKNLKNFEDAIRVYRIVGTESASQQIAVETKIAKPPVLLPPTKPSLTVLPFVDLSPANIPDHFCDGLTMDVMAGLVQIPGLVLISAVSLGNYKLKIISVKEIGKQFGVNHVLDGGIRRIGESVRITTRLIDTSSGRQVWAERFDCKFDDILTVQDKIIQEIIIALDVNLVSGKVGRVLRKVLSNPSAIESYYRGWGALFRSSRADIFLAQQMSKETIRLEPDSPLGYALAALSHWWAVAQNATDDVHLALNQATELAHQAIRLDDVTGLPGLVLAQIHLLNREHDQALSASEESVKVRPSCHASYAVKANILNYLGRFAEAIELAEFAIRLSPVFPPFYSNVLATAYYGDRQHEEAITAGEVSLAIDSKNIDALLLIAGANAALDRMSDAYVATKKVLKIKPKFLLSEFSESQPYKNSQNLEKLTSMLNKAGLL
ncbi:MAG: adenylate/guanylate cyclase domain-containing protein [Desulfobacterales bacterium]|jgi:adenylate cyclase